MKLNVTEQMSAECRGSRGTSQLTAAGHGALVKRHFYVSEPLGIAGSRSRRSCRGGSVQHGGLLVPQSQDKPRSQKQGHGHDEQPREEGAAGETAASPRGSIAAAAPAATSAAGGTLPPLPWSCVG